MRFPAARWLVGVTVVVLLFGGLELLLHLLDLGRGPLVYSPEGLRHQARYIVPDEETGGFITRFRSPVYGERRIPPKGHARRIVLLGASNTRSFGTDLVRGHLERALPGEAWEVVNLGRSGYGSERILLIARQAMELLDPDVLLIYTGDNEFVDYGAFASTGVIRPDVRVDRRVLGLRTVGLLRDLFRPLRPGDNPEPMILTPAAKVHDLSLEEARRHLAGLGRNLQGILREARDREVPVVLLTLLYNRLAPPDGSGLPGDFPDDERRHAEETVARVHALVPSPLRPVFLEPNGTLLAKHWREVTERPTEPFPVDPVAWRRPAAPPLGALRPYANEPWQWSPRVWAVISGLDALRRGDFRPEERNALAEMERLLDELLARAPEHPRGHWLRGMVMLALGRDPARAEAHLVRAASLDGAPRKASEAVNDIIRDVATAHPEALFLDADRRIADLVPGRILGYEWMLDHCHLSIGARNLLLGDVAAAIAARWPRGSARVLGEEAR